MCKYTNPGKTQGSSLDKYSSKYYNPVSKYTSKYKRKEIPCAYICKATTADPFPGGPQCPGRTPRQRCPGAGVRSVAARSTNPI